MNLKEIIIQNNPCNVPLSFIHIQRCASQITNRESLIKLQKRLQNLFEYDSPAVQIIYKRCLSNQKRTRLVTTRSTHLKSHSLAEFYLQCVCVCVCVSVVGEVSHWKLLIVCVSIGIRSFSLPR